MKIIKQSIEFMEYIDAEAILWKIEAAYRNCWKSEGANPDHDPQKRDSLIRACIKKGHHSPLEHASITFRVITNRGVTHELVRHRIASYSQESTRYANYSQDKFGNEITVIWPWFLGEINDTPFEQFSSQQVCWLDAMQNAESAYLELLNLGCKPEEARGVLPNDLKTDIIVTMNIRELRHFIKLRGSKQAHPQIRALALQALAKLHQILPVLFEDLAQEFQINKEETA